MPKLEELARELESIHDRKEELVPLVEHTRDDSYDRDLLLQEILDAKLGYFAAKLAKGYYDDNAADFEKHIAEVAAEAEAQKTATETVKDSINPPGPQIEEPTPEPDPLCEICGAKFDSELHAIHTANEEKVEPAVENQGTEDRPITPPPADPTQPSPELENTPPAPAPPEATLTDEELKAAEAAETPAPETTTVSESNPLLETQPEEPAPQKPGMTTTESLMHEPDAPTDDRTNTETNPLLEQPQLPDCPTCQGIHLTHTKQHPGE